MKQIPNDKPEEPAEVDHVVTSYEKSQPPRQPLTRGQRNIIFLSSIVVVLALVLLVVLVWRSRKAAPAEQPVAPVVSVKVAKVEKQSIAAQVSAVGTIFPRE